MTTHPTILLDVARTTIAERHRAAAAERRVAPLVAARRQALRTRLMRLLRLTHAPADGAAGAGDRGAAVTSRVRAAS